MRAHVFALMAKALADLREVPVSDVIAIPQGKVNPAESEQIDFPSEPMPLSTNS